jgi:hypothetical protein
VCVLHQAELAYDLLVENALAGEENALDEFADQWCVACSGRGVFQRPCAA